MNGILAINHQSPDPIQVEAFDPISLQQIVFPSHFYICGRYLYLEAWSQGLLLEIGPGRGRVDDTIDGIAAQNLSGLSNGEEELVVRQNVNYQVLISKDQIFQGPLPDPIPSLTEERQILPPTIPYGKIYACWNGVPVEYAYEEHGCHSLS